MSRGDPNLPPANLAKRSLAPHTKLIRGLYWRISHQAAPLVDWSSSTGRFSDPSLPLRVLYFSAYKETSFRERFGQELRDQDPDTRALSEAMLSERVWKTIAPTKSSSLRVIDLTNLPTLQKIGADGATFMAAYSFTHAWAQELMNHPDAIDGIVYRSRLFSQKKCVALFERSISEAAIRMQTVSPRPIDDPIVVRILSRESVRLV